MGTIREDLLAIYQAGLNAVNGRSCVRQALTRMIISEAYVAVVAIGKAAVAMFAGAEDCLGDKIKAGLVITREGYGQPGSYHCIESAHPLPKQESLDAGQALVDFLRILPQRAVILVLLSGGASALVEKLQPQYDLAELQQVNEYLLSHNMDIKVMNHIRRHFSLLKGGGLCHYLGGQRVIQLVISDVIDNDIASIGGGLLVPPSTIPELPPLPNWLSRLMIKTEPPRRIQYPLASQIIADNQHALLAAQVAAVLKSYHCQIHPKPLTGDVEQQAFIICESLFHGPRGLQLYGGETTVELPANPGRGGRNQHFALLCAEQLVGRDDCYILAAASDGSDGNTMDAGGLVDGTSVERALTLGVETETARLTANAQHFLTNSQDLITTGPTGTNVMDFVFAYKG